MFDSIKKAVKSINDNVSISRLYKEGDKLYKQERYFEAIEVYQEASELSQKLNIPVTLYNYYAKGMAHIGLEEFDKAEENFSRIINNDAPPPELIYAIAEAYAGLNDWNNAFLLLNNFSKKLIGKNEREFKNCHKVIAKIVKLRENNSKEQKKQDAKILYEKAVEYKNNSQYKEAKDLLLKKVVNVEPNNETYRKELEEVQKLYKAELKKVREIFNSAVSLKNERDYAKALECLNDAYSIMEKQSVEIADIDALKAELTAIIETKEKAEKLYQIGIDCKNREEYGKAINVLKEAIKLNSENEEYKKLLEEIEPLFKEALAKVDELYEQAVAFNNEKNFKQALDVLRDAYAAVYKLDSPDVKFNLKLTCRKKIDTSKMNRLNIELKKESDRLRRAEYLFKMGRNYSANLKFSKAAKALNEAVKMAPECEEYKNLLDEIQRQYENETTRFDNLYDEAIKLRNECNYEKSLEVIEEIYEIAELQEIKTTDLDNLKAEVTTVYENNKKANELYEESLQYKDNKEYNKALEIIKEALSIMPDYELLKTAFEEIKNLYDGEEKRFYEICYKSEELKSKQEYQQALDNLNEAFEIANQQGFLDTKPQNLKEELTGILQNIEAADKLYKKGIDYKNNGEFSKSIEVLEEAVALVPDIEEYRNLLNNVRPMLEAEKERMENLFKKAKSFAEEGDYPSAFDILDNIYNIADRQNFQTDKVDELNTELTDLFEDLKIAEADYDEAVKLFNSKEYKKAINCLEKACKLVPKSTKYERKLSEIKQEWSEIKARANDYYEKALEYYNEDNIAEARNCINNALNLISVKSYEKLKENIEIREEEIQNEQKAETLYNDALLNFENKYYSPALELISEALSLVPKNNNYKNLKKKITKAKTEEENAAKVKELIEYARLELDDADFPSALDSLNKAKELQPENETIQELLEKANLGKIEIKTCTKEALLTLDYIDDDLADNIIECREDGMMWHDYQSFADYFEFPPHLMLRLEEDFLFPPKPVSKSGRTLDL